nr:MAG TPA: hypothetical protein [Caudoviricetes sp.]
MTGVKGKYFSAPIFMRAIKNARIMRQLTTALSGLSMYGSGLSGGSLCGLILDPEIGAGMSDVELAVGVAGMLREERPISIPTGGDLKGACSNIIRGLRIMGESSNWPPEEDSGKIRILADAMKQNPGACEFSFQVQGFGETL